MRERGYYSARTGKNPAASKLDLSGMKKLFIRAYSKAQATFLLQEALGFNCVDAGDVPGALGEDVEGAVLMALRKDNLWPLPEKLAAYSEEDLFDMVEFLFDQVSKPVDGTFHSYGGCGWHYSTFNRPQGQTEFRSILNPILASYGEGFTLSENGEMLRLPEAGMAKLVDASLPKCDPENVEKRVELATAQFRRHKSSLDDRRQAIRELADVLEFLRPRVKKVLAGKDEGDLFNIANNFGIRHHNVEQKTDYDTAIWFSWMFYYYLATIHACLHLLSRRQAMSATRGKSK